MTPQEKVKELAMAAKYCKENGLYLHHELRILENGTREQKYDMMCRAVIRMEICSTKKCNNEIHT